MTVVPRILLFDSGVGALSLLAELRAALPAAQFIYASDNAAYPYGTRSETVVTERVATVLEALHAQFAPDLIVVGCNTASTVALPRLRTRLTMPVVGVVPAIKPAAALTRTGCMALLATPATVCRSYTQQLIDEFAGGCEVVRLGSSELVELAECKLRGAVIEPGQIARILAPLHTPPRGTRIDTIVLGCTHFPLLADELRIAFGRPVHWVDSAAAIARRAASLLTGDHHSNAGHTGDRRTDLAVFTKQPEPGLLPALARYGFQRMEIIPCEPARLVTSETSDTGQRTRPA